MIILNPKYVSWEWGSGGWVRATELHIPLRDFKKTRQTLFLALKFSKSINGDKTHANTDKEKRPKKKKNCIKSRIKNILTRKID